MFASARVAGASDSPLRLAEELQRQAQERYEAARGGEPERLASGSDDFTLALWLPETDKKPLERMTGHQQLVNDVRFSPDMRLLASASFDKSVKLWDGRTGKWVAASSCPLAVRAGDAPRLPLSV